MIGDRFNFRGKKGLSNVVAYVLLIAIVIALAILIYGWLKMVVLADELPDCGPNVNLVIDDYDCVIDSSDITDSQINVTIRNKGLFFVDGYITRIHTREGAEFAFYTLNDTGKRISPDGVVRDEYVHADILRAIDPIPLYSDLTLIEIQPFLIDDESGQISCKSLVSQEIACSDSILCGDGIWQSGETCDKVLHAGRCNDNCEWIDGFSYCDCGDGRLNDSSQCGEVCDNGTWWHEQPGHICKPDCTLRTAADGFCGDGDLDLGFYDDGSVSIETCDNGSAENHRGSGCNETCQADSCGDGSWDRYYTYTDIDGSTWFGEQCEYRNLTQAPFCEDTCRWDTTAYTYYNTGCLSRDLFPLGNVTFDYASGGCSLGTDCDCWIYRPDSNVDIELWARIPGAYLFTYEAIMNCNSPSGLCVSEGGYYQDAEYYSVTCPGNYTEFWDRYAEDYPLGFRTYDVGGVKTSCADAGHSEPYCEQNYDVYENRTIVCHFNAGPNTVTLETIGDAAHGPNGGSIHLERFSIEGPIAV
jgi:flagellin-like protein